MQSYFLNQFQVGANILFPQIIVLLRISKNYILNFLKLILCQDLEYFVLSVFLENYFANQDVRIVILVNQVGNMNIIIIRVIVLAQNGFSGDAIAWVVTFDKTQIFRTKIGIRLQGCEIKLTFSRRIEILQKDPQELTVLLPEYLVLAFSQIVWTYFLELADSNEPI